MREVITYSLCNHYNNSDKYYEEISIFTDEVIGEVYNFTNEYSKDFQDFIIKNCIEDVRSNIEYSLELLILGVLWRTYINKAITLKKYQRIYL
ncbi:hypothetical protein [[Clostridium] dakarense]|uniref:hypothetical protein n=1 Tax=Faecalimicrobium dakarense TaxID=1301100 RepID=UPI0004B86412|nr:hypothetical protein [[Clostridium] dakarense]